MTVGSLKLIPVHTDMRISRFLRLACTVSSEEMVPLSQPYKSLIMFF